MGMHEPDWGYEEYLSQHLQGKGQLWRPFRATYESAGLMLSVSVNNDI